MNLANLFLFVAFSSDLVSYVTARRRIKPPASFQEVIDRGTTILVLQGEFVHRMFEAAPPGSDMAAVRRCCLREMFPRRETNFEAMEKVLLDT